MRDPNPRTPWRATPLAPFVAAEVLTSADVHVAARLARMAREADDRVLLAVALTVAALRAGSVCVRLDDAAGLAATFVDSDEAAADDLPWPPAADWHAAVRASPLVADGVDGPADRPVRWVDGRVYLDRYWRDEVVVREQVAARRTLDDSDPAAARAAAERLFPADDDAQQRAAVRAAAARRLMVLTGGPGTGKTTTVARLVAALQEVAGGTGLRVALAAPTGKAAARLQESVNAEVARLSEVDQAAVGALTASTLHRLLGPIPGSSARFRHDRGNQLPHDVVIVDESSMVALPLMARLVEAVRPGSRLILVGDPDQLASVDAGAVLGDLVASLDEGVVELTTAHRYGRDLGALASAVRAGDADAALELLRAGGPHISFTATAGEFATAGEAAGVRADIEAAGAALVAAAVAGDAESALAALAGHRLLLAHREGYAGVEHWAQAAESWIAAATRSRGSDTRANAPWALGTPLIVTENDRASGLYNGDSGVVIRDPAGDEDAAIVAFGDVTSPHLVRPHRLPAVRPVHAMTVHRGQGSQFARVSVLLPPSSSPLLTRELLYTAITRARDSVHVVGSEAAVRAAVMRPIRRASGLREPLGSGWRGAGAG